jgi:hypothetical protein
MVINVQLNLQLQHAEEVEQTCVCALRTDTRRQIRRVPAVLSRQEHRVESQRL